jgi:hypothetical protein
MVIQRFLGNFQRNEQKYQAINQKETQLEGLFGLNQLTYWDYIQTDAF